MYENTQARLIANSGIEIYLEKMRRDKTLSGTFLNQKGIDGSYDLYISGPDTNLTIRSIGYYMDVQHETIVQARRDPVKFPIPPASLYVSTSAMQNIFMNGNFTVSGWNHDKDGNVISKTQTGGATPGVAVDNPSDSSKMVDILKTNTANNITGVDGITPDVRVKNIGVDWANISKDLAFSADATLGSGSYQTETFGTYTSPQITMINGNADFTGNVTGAGILIINGDVSIAGTFNFQGLVIAYKESKITTKLNGDGSVIGSFVVSGNSVDMNISNGTFSALYSSAALENAKANLKSARFRILSWWE
jgi:hypothetical protein